MILHEERNKQIIEELVQNIIQLENNQQLKWNRISSIQIRTTTDQGQITFYAHQKFSLKGWEISPAFFELHTKNLKLNLYLNEYPKLSDLGKTLIDRYLSDLTGNNEEATQELLAFSKSLSKEVFRDLRIKDILENK